MFRHAAASLHLHTKSLVRSSASRLNITARSLSTTSTTITGWNGETKSTTTNNNINNKTETHVSSYFSTRTEPSDILNELANSNKGDTIAKATMFCRQCEQTSQHYACTTVGVCGKTSETSAVQDALLYVAIQSVSPWMVQANEAAASANTNSMKVSEVEGLLDAVHVWTVQALFATMTNVNFSSDRIIEFIEQGLDYQRQLEDLVLNRMNGTAPPSLAIEDTVLQNDTNHQSNSAKAIRTLRDFISTALNKPADITKTDWENFGKLVSVPVRQAELHHNDCFSLLEVSTYGIKGACAYTAHCHELLECMTDESDPTIATMKADYQQILNDIQQVLAELGTLPYNMAHSIATASKQEDSSTTTTVDSYVDIAVQLALRVGEINSRVLKLLDSAHVTLYGVPEPTPVLMTATEGKCILISGHDLRDLHALLEQTKDTGINVYTHGELLPAHGYPNLKQQYPHLVGNYGTAWQNQKFEFAAFPGPIIVTTNCIIEPRRNYRQRLYTMNQVGYDGVAHIGTDRDFSGVIEQALALEGFPRTIDPPSYHTVGFNHRAVLPLAGDVLKAVSDGHLSRIVLIGGCDGSQFERNYFTDLAETLPDDTLILTLGCAKNRFIQSERLHGATLANGMPRILDMGQCNDAYSAVVVASELAKALNCESVNDLPLSICLSHLEQKAAAVLLTLLNMGVQNIRLGPTVPAYLTPNVLNVLVQNYNIMATGDVEEDVKAIMSGK